MDQNLVVIVDDEEDILDLLSYNFSRHGYAVKTFDRAKNAWDFLCEHTPSAILCDWMMPGMNGLELCQKLKGNDILSSVPFLMVTCRNEPEAISLAHSKGVTAFISKPVKIQELLNRVKALV